MNVTLYIPCFNTASYLDKVIPAVMMQTYPLKEVLIIDDGSTDSTVETAQRYIDSTKYPLRIIRHPNNRGLAAARNTGIKAANSEFIASLDGDCVPEPNWLEELMAHFSDKAVVGVGGMLIESTIRGVADKWRALHMKQDWGRDVIINPRFLFGHSNVFRVSAIQNAGGYDERFRTNAEDYHISLSLYKAGHRLIYEPNAKVHHLKVDTIRSVLTAYWRYGNCEFQPTLVIMFKRCLSHLITGVKFVSNDILSCHWSVVHVSFILSFFMIYSDSRMWFRKAMNG